MGPRAGRVASAPAIRPEELLAAGWRRGVATAAALIDRFRGRIMFPLCDERGRVLGFGARALRPDESPST